MEGAHNVLVKPFLLAGGLHKPLLNLNMGPTRADGVLPLPSLLIFSLA